MFVCDFISEIVNYTLTVVISCYCIRCLQDFYELQKLCASPASLILAPSCCFGKSGEGVAVTHLSVWEVISQAVQKFVKHLKPRQITGKRCEHFFGRNVLEIHNNTNTTTTPEYAEAGVIVVGKAAEAKALASLKIGEDKGKVLHSTSVPESEQTKGKMYTWVREFVE